MAATAEEEVILKHRLLTHTAVSKGDPPFKKLAKRYLQFCQAAQDNTKDVDDLYKTLVKDLTAIQFQMEKMQFQCESLEYERELYERKQAQLQSDIQQAHQLIQQRKKELQEAKVWRKHQEEYEGIKKLIVDQPSRQTTLASIEQLQADIAALEAQKQAAIQAHEKRRKQFAMLMYCIEELQGAVEEEEGVVEEGAVAMQVDS